MFSSTTRLVLAVAGLLLTVVFLVHFTNKFYTNPAKFDNAFDRGDFELNPEIIELGQYKSAVMFPLPDYVPVGHVGIEDHPRLFSISGCTTLYTTASAENWFDFEDLQFLGKIPIQEGVYAVTDYLHPEEVLITTYATYPDPSYPHQVHVCVPEGVTINLVIWFK